MVLSQYQIDSLKELLNIGIGKAAGIINDMTKSHVRLNVPSVKALTSEELNIEIKSLVEETLAIVRLDFQGDFSGLSALMFPTASASKIVDLFTGDDSQSTDLDSIRVGTLTEVGNIILNGVIGSISNVLKNRFVYSIPVYQECTMEDFIVTIENDFGTVEVGILVDVHFFVEKLEISGDVILVFKMGSVTKLIESIESQYGA